MFEAGLPAQRHGDNIQSARDAAAAEGVRLIQIARQGGKYIPKSQWEQFGDRKRLPSGESIVYLSSDSATITKIRNPWAKAAIKNLRPQDIIYEHLVHNILFPGTRYALNGISEDIDGIRIVLSQPYIPMKFLSPSQKQIDKYVTQQMGLRKESPYMYGNSLIAITDISADGDNVLAGDNGELYFIDPIIVLKKPATEVLEHYYKMLQD